MTATTGRRLTSSVSTRSAYESPPFGEDAIRQRERIRVDLDGFGHGGASMHAPTRTCR